MSGTADLAFHREPARVADRARGGEFGSECLREILDDESAAVEDAARAALMKVIAMADVRERLLSGALEPAPMSRDQFSRMIAEDVKVWAEVVRSARLRTE